MTGNKYSVFQIVVFGVFAFFIVVAVFIFAGLGNVGGDPEVGTVRIWGTFDQDMVDDYLTQLNDVDSMAGAIEYTQFREDEFQSELVEALASGRGPDLFFIDQAHILRHWSKILPISYDSMSRREYIDTFIDEGQLFLSLDSGILAMPFAVDPLVLYWNRDIFAAKSFAKPPTYWDELVFMSEKITEKDPKGNISLATIAFGTYNNVTNAKDIITTLIMQKGGYIIGKTEDGALYSALVPQDGTLGGASPAQVAVRTFTEFANPVKTIYTWNRSLPESKEMFSQGKLAMYVGYASEVRDIQARNPNLNFDVAMLPQIRTGDGVRTLTTGKMYALAMPRQSANQYGARVITSFLSGPLASNFFASMNSMSSPRRGVLAKEQDDVLQEIFRKSSLRATGWLDPYPEKTDEIFRSMIESIISGRLRFTDAVSLADREMRELIK